MKEESRGNRLLWIVAGVFVLQITVWSLWFAFAQKHKPTEIQLPPKASNSRPASPGP